MLIYFFNFSWTLLNYPSASYLTISVKEPVLRWNYGQENRESNCKFSKNMLIKKN